MKYYEYNLHCLLLQCEFLICVVLTLLGYIPGIIYAVYAIVVRDGQTDDEDYFQPINP